MKKLTAAQIDRIWNKVDGDHRLLAREVEKRTMEKMAEEAVPQASSADSPSPPSIDAETGPSEPQSEAPPTS